MGGGNDPKGFERRRFPVGEVIIQQGEMGRRAYLVEEGAVEVSRGYGEKRKVLGRVGPGGIFGEMALLDGTTRMADVTAVSDTLCVVIPGEILQEKLEKTDPFIRALIRIMARNVRNLTEVLVEKD
ncbi:MAG: cyclic nucleotide-binding domain-containing protein [Rhodospirillaceae bacterium]